MTNKNKSKIAGYILVSVLAAWIIMAQSCLRFRTDDLTALKQFHDSGAGLKLRTIKVNNRSLHYAQTGNDSLATLVFIHGSPGSWEAFASFMRDKDLLLQYRIVSIDRPGFGYSNYGKGVPLDTQVNMIGELLGNIQNSRPVYIIGHSLGGPICVMLAATYPKYVAGVVLLAASVDPNEEKPEKWRPIMKTPPFRWLMPGAFCPSNDELWYFKKTVKKMPDDLHKITCPVIIIQGLLDPLVPPGNAFYAKKELIHAQNVNLITLDSANHFIPWTRYNVIKGALMNMDKMMHTQTAVPSGYK